jgi:hypothetical protein
LAGGGECVADLAALRNQPDLFGEVASAPTTWQAVHEIDDTVHEIDDTVLDGLRRRGPRCGRRPLHPRR